MIHSFNCLFNLFLFIPWHLDVFEGVQIAYFAIIGTQCSMILLSVVLIFGIYKVRFIFFFTTKKLQNNVVSQTVGIQLVQHRKSFDSFINDSRRFA